MLVTRRRRVAALTIAGALALAACGDTDDDPTGAEPAVTEPTGGPTGAPDTGTDTETDSGTGTDDTSSVTTATDDTSSVTTATEATVVADPTEAPATEVPEILQFSAPTVGGGELDMAAIGDRPVLLWFWAPF